MDQIGSAALATLAWVCANPFAALIALVTFLTGLVAAYHRFEPRIKTYVQSTTVTWDDEALDSIDRAFRNLDVVLGFLRLFLPGMVERARQPVIPSPTRDHPRSTPPPSSPGET